MKACGYADMRVRNLSCRTEQAPTNQMQFTQLGRFVPVPGRLDRYRVLSAESVQNGIVHDSRVTVAPKENPAFLPQTARVVAKPETVVLPGAPRRHEVVQAGGRSGLDLREWNGRVAD